MHLAAADRVKKGAMSISVNRPHNYIRNLQLLRDAQQRKPPTASKTASLARDRSRIRLTSLAFFSSEWSRAIFIFYSDLYLRCKVNSRLRCEQIALRSRECESRTLEAFEFSVHGWGESAGGRSLCEYLNIGISKRASKSSISLREWTMRCHPFAGPFIMKASEFGERVVKLESEGERRVPSCSRCQLL